MKIGIASLLVLVFLVVTVAAQSGGHILFGDIKVDEREAGASAIATFQVLLYAESGNLLMRQTVPANGRYRFLDLRNGRYELVVEYENKELARITVSVNSPFKTDFRQDVELQWRSGSTTSKASVVSATEFYSRSPANASLLRQAMQATEKKQYERAISLMRQIVDADDKDFPVWEELGTNFFITKTFFEAESCYLKALQLKPDFLPAMINLGRLRVVVKNLNGAIEVLNRAVTLHPTSPEANYFLGEAYLQAKLGSKAVPYLNEAIKLDPVTMADAHLLLAALYNAKGLKDKAAAEYAAFLKQRPDYSDRKKLEAYISAAKVRN
ncbi:MAG TPA: tetratricopeptide repeat protein [Pyrinomonadaceae bacterium]